MNEVSERVANPAERPSRSDLVTLLQYTLETLVPEAAGRAAWQGPSGAVTTWRQANGADDLDIWADEVGARVLDEVLLPLPAATVQVSADSSRLRHRSYAVETINGIAVIDVTRGDLMVGPITLMPAERILVGESPEGPRLVGEAAVADLVLRKLLRGGVPPRGRVEQARREWGTLTKAAQQTAVSQWTQQLGQRVAHDVQLLLIDKTRSADAALAKRTRHRLLRASVEPRNLPATWRQRHTVIPAFRGGPLDLRTRGVVVVLVGTDGSGKSTVARNLSHRLGQSGFHVVSPYFGMARGNLPGVNLARKLLGIAQESEDVGQNVTESPTEPTARQAPDLQHAGIRRLAAWYYAGEYVLRWLREVAPALVRNDVVVADRYIYDLRESPWPGSRAADVLEAILPAPDFLVLPDAPDSIIHARKPERPAWEQAEQQDRFRRLVDQQPARIASVTVDSSGSSADSLAELLAAIVQAAHLPKRWSQHEPGG